MQREFKSEIKPKESNYDWVNVTNAGSYNSCSDRQPSPSHEALTERSHGQNDKSSQVLGKISKMLLLDMVQSFEKNWKTGVKRISK